LIQNCVRDSTVTPNQRFHSRRHSCQAGAGHPSRYWWAAATATVNAQPLNANGAQLVPRSPPKRPPTTRDRAPPPPRGLEKKEEKHKPAVDASYGRGAHPSRTIRTARRVDAARATEAPPRRRRRVEGHAPRTAAVYAQQRRYEAPPAPRLGAPPPPLRAVIGTATATAVAP